MSKVTIQSLNEKVKNGVPIAMMTAYDYPCAVLEDEAGIDIILVGDSLYMTLLGHSSTLPAKMSTMVEHAEAVRRGAPNAFVIGDMPYMSYQASPVEAVRNAGRYMKEAGVDGIKLEGGKDVAETVRILTKATIPVMGHLGLTPQSMSLLGGFKAQGRNLVAAERIIEDAKILEEAGAFGILLECVPAEIGQIITARSRVPIISIGAGPYCHGQLMIVHDLLGICKTVPKFAQKYADLNRIAAEAMQTFKREVETKIYPDPDRHCYKMDEEARKTIMKKYFG